MGTTQLEQTTSKSLDYNVTTHKTQLPSAKYKLIMITSNEDYSVGTDYK